MCSFKLKMHQNRFRPGSRDSLNFWALYANCLKTVKGTNFKFDKHVPRGSHMTPKIFWKRRRDQGHVSLNFWALYANCSKTVQGTNFKFDKHVPRDSNYWLRYSSILFRGDALWSNHHDLPICVSTPCPKMDSFYHCCNFVPCEGIFLIFSEYTPHEICNN